MPTVSTTLLRAFRRSATRAALLGALLAAAPLLPGTARATQYPLTVTDLAGRQVVISKRPQRVVLQDGRNIALLALLDRENPFERVVIWNNIPSRADVANWEVLRGRWPAAAAIPDMGFGDNGQVDAERILAQRPDLVIAERRAMTSLTETGADQRLASLGIPLLLVDTFNDPADNAIRSVRLAGQALDREAEAAEYADFAEARLKRLRDTVAAQSQHPRVFIEARAGIGGPNQCCNTQARVGWGSLVETLGGRNIGAELITGTGGEVTLETVIAQRPDVYVMTTAGWNGAGAVSVPFGVPSAEAPAQAALGRLEGRPGFAATPAAQNNRVFGIWHGFYNHAYNIVGLEYLAKFLYPDQFRDLDPAATWNTILSRFTRVPPEPFLFAAQAPAVGSLR
ncbi:ABC transporter substrate-binding protein [Roseomonas sp. BN140053]|uniref:ABC transporter substrate-binding protein n=1 Tax=Roseomonas sp. BN140053 TaxID=3391898 RepID=UPI0039ED2F15